MNVLMVCAVGMSSSSLAEKVRARLKERGIQDIKIGACGSNQIRDYAIQADLILIAPQISYLKKNLVADGLNQIAVMDAKSYGMQDVDQIIELIMHPEKAEEKKDTKANILRRIAEVIGTNYILLAIRDGMIDILPVTVVGSVFSLLKSFPLDAWTDFIDRTGIIDYLSTGYSMTIGMVAVYVALTISYHIAKYKKRNGTGVGLTSLICFFLVTGASSKDALDMTYFGSRGMFTAMLTAVIVGELFTYVDVHTSFRPDSRMPKNIGESFRSLLPAFACIGIVLAGSSLIALTSYHTIPETIDTVMTNRVAAIAGTNGISYLAVSILSNVLWFFGVHGGQIVGSVTTPIYSPLAIDNLAAWQAGKALPYMVIKNINLLFTFGGAGSTLSLSLMMMLFSKSKKLKSLGKISFPMGIFFINEPVIFGLPIMMNPILFLPFVFIPVISGGLTFLCMSAGIIPYMIGFDVPWTTPPIIFGFLQGGLSLAVWQVLMFLLQFFLWYPFFHYYDKKEYAKEISTN